MRGGRNTLILLKESLSLMERLEQAGANNYIMGMLNYLADQGRERNLSSLFKSITEEAPDMSKKAMTIGIKTARDTERGGFNNDRIIKKPLFSYW